MIPHLKGKSIRLFLVDGTPQGILVAEIMNWTGHVISAPRAKLAELIQRPEMSRTGIYFLTGIDPNGSAKIMVYIGESDNVGKRLVQHNKDNTKDFWEKACIITSKDHNLTKAHARYLESRLIYIVQSADHALRVNSTAPEYGYLPEADIADMEYFISQVRLIMPVLGFDFLREKPVVNSHVNNNSSVIAENIQSEASPIFVLASQKHNLNAKAQEVEGEFIVFAGSEAQKQWTSKGNHSYKMLYQGLTENKKLELAPDHSKLIFQEDVIFNSPSAAAAIILGRPANGRIEWKVKDTYKTYADWQNDQLVEIKADTLYP